MNRIRRFPVLIFAMAASVCGCSSISNPGVNSLASLFDTESQQREEELHRSRFQETRSPSDLQWLMRNCIQTGMTPTEISRVIGEDGERVFDDSWIKTRGGHYYAGDHTWKWGPDRKGNSIYLVFRNNKLVNFNPDEFRQHPDS
ncbi:hypothetical protein GC176_22410 [bacterium]|nr:hypothetical protein [bacterium]